MVEVPVTTEMTDFAVKVAKLTRLNRLEWETTADGDVLIAPLGGEYTARLDRPYYEELDEPYKGVELGLVKGRTELFRLSPYHLQGTDFSKRMGSSKQAVSDLFTELWTRAFMKASRMAEDLDKVNSFLTNKLGDDDDEVPF